MNHMSHCMPDCTMPDCTMHLPLNHTHMLEQVTAVSRKHFLLQQKYVRAGGLS